MDCLKLSSLLRLFFSFVLLSHSGAFSFCLWSGGSYTHAYTCIHTYTYIHVYTYVYMYLYTYIYVYMYVYIYMYKYTISRFSIPSLTAGSAMKTLYIIT